MTDLGTNNGDAATVAAVRERMADVAGIAGLDIDLRDDGVPRLRVQLDGSVPSDLVGEEIRRRLAELSSPAPGGNGRRSGLGKGLSEILAADAESEAPRYLQQATDTADPVAPAKLALVAVEETVGGISVRAADSVGGLAFSPVEDQRSLNQAVVSAIGRLRHERPLPRLAGVEVRDVDGSAVLTVVLNRADGRRSVGAALVEGGMPFTLGSAVWEALN